MDNLTDRRKRLEKILSYVMPGVLPIIIMGAAFALNGVTPFGGKQIIVGDFWDQYYPFISDYWYKIREGSSLLWSWTAGAGHDYLANIAYYLASPFNLLAVLFPHALLREILTVFLLVKLGLAGFFMVVYLRRTTKRNDLLLPLFASMYALCAFTLGYYCNIMWFDTFALLPLVMLGVYKLVGEGIFQLYVFSLAAAVIFNFYIGVFVCIFSAIWFFTLCYTQNLTLREFFQKLALIAVFSAIAIGLTAFLTLPAYNAIRHTFGSVYGNAFPDSVQLRHSFFDVLGNFLAFTPPTFKSGLPNLYSGMISIMLLPLFLLSKKISHKEKLAYMLVTVFLLISTNVNVLDYMWHGFSYPTGLPARYSFLITFVLVTMAYRAYLLMEDMQKQDIIAMFGAAALFFTMAVLGSQETKYIIGSAVLCGVYLCLFAISLKGKVALQRSKHMGALQQRKSKGALQQRNSKNASKRKDKSNLQPQAKKNQLIWIKPVFFAVIVIELLCSAYIGVKAVGTTDIVNYPPQYSNIQQLLDMRRPMETDFYRTDATWRESYNDTSLYGYEGVSVWTNIINARSTFFMEGLGLTCSGIDNSYYYARTSPLTDAFLNMLYLLDRDYKPTDDCVFWKMAAKDGGLVLLENNYYLPLGCMVNGETADYKGFSGTPYRARFDTSGRVVEGFAGLLNAQIAAYGGTAAATPFSAQNDLFSRATGLEGDLFSMIDPINIESLSYKVLNQAPGKYTFTSLNNSGNGVFIFDYEMPSTGCLFVYVWVEGANEAKIAL